MTPRLCGIYHPQKGTINVSGGIIQGSTGLQMCSGNLSVVNMNGGSIIGTGEDEREEKLVMEQCQMDQVSQLSIAQDIVEYHLLR